MNAIDRLKAQAREQAKARDEALSRRTVRAIVEDVEEALSQVSLPTDLFFEVCRSLEHIASRCGDR